MTKVVIPAKAGIQLCALAILLGTVSRAGADDILKRPVPEALVKDVNCMVKVLRTMPQIEHIKSEAVRIGGMPQASVEYRDNSKVGEGTTLRFRANGLEPPYFFQIGLGGLVDSRIGHPHSFGVDRVMTAWKARCDVNSVILFI